MAGYSPRRPGSRQSVRRNAQKNTRDRPRPFFYTIRRQENGERAATAGNLSFLRVKGSRRPPRVFFCYAAGIPPRRSRRASHKAQEGGHRVSQK